MALVDQIKQIIGPLVERETTIKAVYLFGSSLKTNMARASDIDLGFVLDEDAYKTEPFNAIRPAYMIGTRIALRLDTETDVVVLNSSSIEIAYEIISTGLCIYEEDLDYRLEYEARIRGLYFDFFPFLKMLRSECLTRL